LAASLNYSDASRPADRRSTFTLPGTDGVNAMTFICICLFIGAMGKSARVPLHVWLPDSMEGPTPISADPRGNHDDRGHFHLARMSPLFEFSEYALNFVLFIGATTALFMGFLASSTTTSSGWWLTPRSRSRFYDRRWVSGLQPASSIS
jgi:NADH-quinone oxidoreductase subunit L